MEGGAQRPEIRVRLRGKDAGYRENRARRRMTYNDWFRQLRALWREELRAWDAISGMGIIVEMRKGFRYDAVPYNLIAVHSLDPLRFAGPQPTIRLTGVWRYGNVTLSEDVD